MNYFFIGLALILGGGIVAEFLPDRTKTYALSFFTGLGAALLSGISFNVIVNNEVLTQIVGFSSLIGDITIMIDRLTAFFIILISLMSFVGVLFSIGYLKKYIQEKKSLAFHFLFLSTLIVSMILITAIQNALAFLIVWELMSLSSFMLVVFESESKGTLEAGINYLIAMHIGVAFLIIGFAYLSVQSGSMDFESFRNIFESNKQVMNLVFILFFIGFGTKAGFVPFHTWLPKAHPAAPGHISAMMSGIMLKTGIYGILRILTLIKTPSMEITAGIIGISIVTIILGITYAVYERDIKKALAYSSIENIGIIGLAIGIGSLGLTSGSPIVAMLGFSGALFHVMNHAIFKMLLFFNAGYLYQRSGTRNMEEMGGMAKFLPKSSVLFVIGSIALCGLPPLNGFIGEAVMYCAMIEGVKSNSVILFVASLSSMAVLALIGSMALIAFTKAYGIIYSGSMRSNRVVDTKKESMAVIFPMSVLAVFIIAIGLLPLPVFDFISGIVSVFAVVPPETVGVYRETLFYFSAGGGCLIGGSLAVFLLRSLLLRRRSQRVARHTTWACGYQKVSPRMQYSSSSYSGVFIKMLKPFIDIDYIEELPKGIFPGASRFRSVSLDRFEEYIIKPCVKGIMKFFDIFSIIQSRNVKQYLIYAIAYIIITISIIIGLNK